MRPHSHWKKSRKLLYGAEKAPRLDGFPMFFQKFWSIVSNDLLTLCNDFYNGTSNIELINWANIVLIPKVKTPKLSSNFYPINLINFFIKIISKILASCLGKFIDSLIETKQFAFIEGSCIVDNIIVAKEAIFSLQKRKLQGCVIKVDFTKAFDIVEWNFLLDLLHARGFGPHWRGWVSRILATSKASILVDGSVNGYVRYQRGVRQGDPLPILLFVLVTDVLCTMINNTLSSSVLY